jgi:hypothetical protein
VASLPFCPCFRGRLIGMSVESTNGVGALGPVLTEVAEKCGLFR